MPDLKLPSVRALQCQFGFGLWLPSLMILVLMVGQPPSLAAVETFDAVAADRLEEILAGDEPKTLAELQAMQNHVQQLIKKVMPTVVSIELRASQGSGVVVTEDGYVLTAGHVIAKPNRRAMCRFREGEDPVRAKTLGINNGIDSGLVKLESEQSFPYAEMGDSAQLAKGQWVLAVGHPGGYESKRGAVVRLGRILAINKTGLRTDCALVGGDSGGPLFDMQGRVIGINSRIGDNLDKNIHVPVNTFGNTWDKLANAEMWGEFRQLFKPGFIGLSVDRDSDRAEISKISPGGPAEVAGLKVGDVILEFDGVKTDDYRSLVTIALQTPPDEEVVVRVRRGDEEMEFLLRTEER